MKYKDVNDFMTEYINYDNTIDKEGIFFCLKEVFDENKEKLTSNVPTLYFVDELIYQTFRHRAEFLGIPYPSKNQIVKWFKENDIYKDVSFWVEKSRKERKATVLA